MAVLRKEYSVIDGKIRRVYDYMVETVDDLETIKDAGTGSMAYVLEEDAGQRVYVKVKNDRWEKLVGGDPAEDEEVGQE